MTGTKARISASPLTALLASVPSSEAGRRRRRERQRDPPADVPAQGERARPHGGRDRHDDERRRRGRPDALAEDVDEHGSARIAPPPPTAPTTRPMATPNGIASTTVFTLGTLAVGLAGRARAVVDDVRMARRLRFARLVAAPRSPAVGALAAIGAVAATTLLIYPLRDVAPPCRPASSTLWRCCSSRPTGGCGPGCSPALASAAAFNFFHIPPTGGVSIADSSHWVALGVYLVAAAIASRSRTSRARAPPRPSAGAARPTSPRTPRASCSVGPRSPTRSRGRAAHRHGARAAGRRARPRPGAAGDRPACRWTSARAPATLVLGAGADAAIAARVATACSGARGAAAGGARARRAAGGGRRDAGAAPLGRHQDRAPARRLARPAHAADGDHHGRPRRALARAAQRRARRARARRRRGGAPALGARRQAARSVQAAGRRGRSRTATGARSRRSCAPRQTRSPATAARLRAVLRPRPAARPGRRRPARARLRQPAGERPPLQRRASREGPRARRRRRMSIRVIDRGPGMSARTSGAGLRAVLPRAIRRRARRLRARPGDRPRLRRGQRRPRARRVAARSGHGLRDRAATRRARPRRRRRGAP